MTTKIIFHHMVDLDAAVLDRSELIAEVRPVGANYLIEKKYEEKYLNSKQGEADLVALLKRANPKLKQHILGTIDQKLEECSDDDIELIVLVSPASARDSVKSELFNALNPDSFFSKRLSGFAGFEIFATELKAEIKRHISARQAQHGDDIRSRLRVSVDIKRTLLADMLPQSGVKNDFLLAGDGDDQEDQAPSGEFHTGITLMEGNHWDSSAKSYIVNQVLYPDGLNYMDYKAPKLISRCKHLTILLSIWKTYEEHDPKPGQKYYFTFADDRKDILDELHRFFSKNKDLLPPGVELQLLHYDTYMHADNVEVIPFREVLSNDADVESKIHFRHIKQAVNKFLEMLNFATFVKNSKQAYQRIPFDCLIIREKSMSEFSVVFSALVRLAVSEQDFDAMTERGVAECLRGQKYCDNCFFAAMMQYCQESIGRKLEKSESLASQIDQCRRSFNKYRSQYDSASLARLPFSDDLRQADAAFTACEEYMTELRKLISNLQPATRGRDYSFESLLACMKLNSEMNELFFEKMAPLITHFEQRVSRPIDLLRQHLMSRKKQVKSSLVPKKPIPWDKFNSSFGPDDFQLGKLCSAEQNDAAERQAQQDSESSHQNHFARMKAAMVLRRG